ncbi:DUF4112 domain-containing protein [Tessaracoccus antarcticus]|uniref:DUF4112 domain-containing protein n=1 Tax=Tessaracoccus antarcticus TaxID=2479848 RepID=A0A3M0G0Y8_9ACTN|nr:DUF4112 domain-containing protein [Tessaracoccus antarcticus]RMB58278.1 DUF4112 domain-containing protein [Tessaracoccus antarcticus]
MNDAPDPDTSSLHRARRLAREALEGRVPGAPVDADGLPSTLLPLPPGSPARVSRTIAWVLDDLIRVPGTRIRFGVDPIVTLIPFAGTAVGAVMGTVILVDAVRLRTPVPVVARMVGNYVIDWLLGLVPFIGAFFDAAYRSNHKNFTLLERTIADRDQVRRRTLWYWIGILAMVLVVLAVIVAVPVALLLWLDRAVTGG